MVCQLAQDPRFQDAEATSSAIADTLLQIKVTAALTENLGSRMGFITISAVNGRIILAGTTSDGSLRRKAQKLALEIEGVHDIDNHIMSVPSHGRGPSAESLNA
jgi:osmotically-inducible protein OsmY